MFIISNSTICSEMVKRKIILTLDQFYCVRSASLKTHTYEAVQGPVNRIIIFIMIFSSIIT